MFLVILLLILSVFVIDLLVYSAIKRLFNISIKHQNKNIVFISFWLFTILFGLFALIFILAIKNSSNPDYIIYRNYFTLTGLFLLIYLPKFIFAVFYLIEFLIRYIILFISKTISICNKKFIGLLLSVKFITKTGFAFSVIIFLLIIYGITIGKTDYKVEQVTIHYKNLPESFDGIKIGLISDMHLGSFSKPEDVRKGIDILMKENPDIIVHAGDMINNEAEEALIMLSELKRMHAPLGMFSVLGNHDVGDYRRWKTIVEKQANLEMLTNIQQNAGFKLLLDENIVIKKNNDSIAIIGVNSWGKPPFKKYGNLSKAIKKAENTAFKILLTHNPTHWEEEVAGKNDIALTLSGHTHAMQFGINCCGIFWCPLKWMYKYWAGLYNTGCQYLYVNRGFGYLGFPGRIGMTPEITIIKLRKSI